jgi:hypothetical protein
MSPIRPLWLWQLPPHSAGANAARRSPLDGPQLGLGGLSWQSG